MQDLTPQSSGRQRRSRLRCERWRLASRRRSRPAREAFVGRRVLGTASARASRSRRRSSASSRLRAWLRASCATAVTRGPHRDSRRSRCSSLSAREASTSKTASIREAVTLACWPPGPEDRDARSSTSPSGIVRSRATWRPSLVVVFVLGVGLRLRLVLVVVVGLVVDVGPRGVRVGRAARDRVALVLVGVVDLLAVDRDAAVLVVAQPGRPELGLRPLLVAVIALGPAERLVLVLVVMPVLEVLGRILLQLLHHIALLVGIAGIRHRVPFSRGVGGCVPAHDGYAHRTTMNLATILTDTAAEHADQTALKLDEAEVTYAGLDEASARVAALLRDKGLEPGDRVGVMLPNVPYFAVAYYGVLRAGGVVVPMNVLLKGREVKFYLSDPEAKILFAWHDFAEAAEKGADDAGAECVLVKPGEFEKLLAEVEADADVADRDDDDTAVILYTSGTTGTPKGAELTHSNLTRNVEVASGLWDYTGDDVILGALPLFHSFGQTCALNCAIRAGATLTLLPRFEPGKALEILERDKVTVFLGVPTMYAAMLNCSDREKYDTSCLRMCGSGGAAMPVEVMRGFEEAFDCKVLEGYGLSETSPVASFNHPDRERKPGSIGTPIEGVEMKVVDDDGKEVAQGEVGEIVIKGHNVMKGYWKKDDATAEAIKDGWFYTGDMAQVDEDGYFFIVDRKKDMIIRGGYNVYPREIEEVLYEHPAVAEAAVVGVPHEELGEEVGAAVALKDGQDVSEDELRAHVKEQVAAYKYPRKIWFVDELPKGPTGKILKREIEVPDRVEQA